jgi:hypothetical protein
VRWQLLRQTLLRLPWPVCAACAAVAGQRHQWQWLQALLQQLLLPVLLPVLASFLECAQEFRSDLLPLLLVPLQLLLQRQILLLL